MTKLLLVEDDNNLREIYEARLQAEGYTIVSAHDGEEALVVAKAEKPDLIISDVMMPKISGFEMLDILRNTEGLQDVKVIMLTALGQSDDQQRADRLGADRYLVKSQVTLEDIVKVAHDLLGDSGTAAPADTAAPATATDTAATPTPATPAMPPVPEPTAVAPAPTPEPTPSAPVPAPDDNPTSPSPDPTPATPSSPPVIPAEPVTSVASTPTSGSMLGGSNGALSEAGAVPTTTSSAAEPSAKEEAEVEAQIEDFVAGATEKATATESSTPASSEPDPTAAPATEPKIEEPVAPAAPSPAENTEHPVQDSAAAFEADDKLVSEAADALVASTKDAEEAAKAPEVEDKTSESKDETEDTGELPQPKKVGGERVIEPIAGEPKKDLDALLAIEEAKESQAKPPTTPIPVIVDDKAGSVPPAPVNPVAPAPPAPSGQVDPNIIAL